MNTTTTAETKKQPSDKFILNTYSQKKNTSMQSITNNNKTILLSSNICLKQLWNDGVITRK